MALGIAGKETGLASDGACHTLEGGVAANMVRHLAAVISPSTLAGRAVVGVLSSKWLTPLVKWD